VGSPFVFSQPAIACGDTVTFTLDGMKRVQIFTGAEGSRWFVRTCVAFVVAALYLAVNEWLRPSAPPFTGRLAWIAELVYVMAGPNGLVLLWLLAALALLAIARFVWRHTPKLPTDSWLWSR
jgi:hypothetical protein